MLASRTPLIHTLPAVGVGIALLCTLVLLTAADANAQTTLTDVYRQQNITNQTAMTVLGSWAAVNIIGGAYLSTRTTGEDKYFHQMNALWNTVNLSIAAVGYFTALKGSGNPSAFNVINDHYGFQKVLLFNTGLDVGYVIGGAYLLERSKNDTDRADQWKGWGRALVLQGAFLFCFDLTTYIIHHTHDRALERAIERVSISDSGIGIRYSLSVANKR